jgi:hypothetical protein
VSSTNLARGNANRIQPGAILVAMDISFPYAINPAAPRRNASVLESVCSRLKLVLLRGDAALIRRLIRRAEQCLHGCELSIAELNLHLVIPDTFQIAFVEPRGRTAEATTNAIRVAMKRGGYRLLTRGLLAHDLCSSSNIRNDVHSVCGVTRSANAISKLVREVAQSCAGGAVVFAYELVHVPSLRIIWRTAE